MADADATSELAERMRSARARHQPLAIAGGGTKAFFGRMLRGEPLSTTAHRGIVTYDPAELVVTVRAGTPLVELESVLAEQGQCLPFEPPHYGPQATVGGMVAAGLAGPARATAGAVRDYVLGVRLLTGDARVLRFGGEVIKNVAGYDVSRLLAGSLGILGVLLEISLKVLPRRPAATTRALEVPPAAALEYTTRLARSAVPLTASCWIDDRLYLRLEASEAALAGLERQVGGERIDDGTAFWHSIREQTHPFFTGATTVVRAHLPASAPPLDRPQCIEWHGMQRWYTDLAPATLATERQDDRAQLTAFRGAGDDRDVFAPLPGPLMQLHRELKRVFDPDGIMNPGRMYPEL